jgi:hypothetical protein
MMPTAFMSDKRKKEVLYASRVVGGAFVRRQAELEEQGEIQRAREMLAWHRNINELVLELTE